MAFYDKFPYTNFQELNLDWILQYLKAQEEQIKNFIAVSSIKYADPIQWNITTQYEANTIVIDPQTGTAYISTQPVPSGVALSNADYWTVVFDLQTIIDMIGGDIQDVQDALDEETNNRIAADADLQNQIDALGGDVTKAAQNYFNAFSMRRVLRDVHLVNKYASDFNLGAADFIAQGACWIPSTNRLVCAFVNNYNDMTVLAEYDLSAGTKLRESAQLALGHCNGISYDQTNNRLVIAPSSHRTAGVATPWDGIVFVDYSTFSIIGSVPTADRFLTVSKDPVTNVWYASNEYNIYRVDDLDTMQYEAVCNLPYGDAWTDQGCAFYNGYAFKVTYNPTGIRIFKISDGSNLKNIPIADVYGQYLTGELQSLTISPSGECIITSDVFSYWQTGYMMQVWHADLFKSDIPTGEIYATVPTDAYIDGTATDMNPTGETSHPFSTLCDIEMRLKAASTWTREVRFANNNHVFNEVLTIRDCKIFLTSNTGSPVLAGLVLENADATIRRLIIGNDSMPNISIKNLEMLASMARFDIATLNGTIHMSRSDINTEGLTLGSDYSLADSIFEGFQTCSEILPGELLHTRQAVYNGMPFGGSGYLTSNGTKIYGMIPLPSRASVFAMANTPTLSGNITVYGAAGQLLSGAASGYSITTYESYLYYTMTITAGATPNNTPVFAYLTGDVRL